MADVYVNARTGMLPGGANVADVSIALFNAGGTKVTTDITDADGMAYLGDRAAGAYTLYVTAPAGVAVIGGNRAAITVVGTDPQIFDVLVTQAALPEATDTRFCNCSGFFVSQYGLPQPGVALLFSEGTLPQLLHYAATGYSHAVLPSSLQIVTDSTGWAAVTLIRGAVYSVVIPGYGNMTWDITVPNASAASLPDVLFPVVAGVTYKDGASTLMPANAPTISVAAGVEKELSITTQYLSGLLVAGSATLSLESSDEDVLTISLTSTGIVLQAIAAGTATVGVTRSETEETQATAYPYPDVWGSLTVTVT